MTTPTNHNKDNIGATTLLVALFLMLLAGVLSNPAVAKSTTAPVVKSFVASASYGGAAAAKVDTIVVTATRLK